MSLSWPWALLTLLVLPMLAITWWWARRRRRHATVRVTSIALVRAALPGRTRWRRRIPVVLLTAGLLVLAIGAARPKASVIVPSSAATIMLALDVSGSMCSTDVAPNRITAAENAASNFIKSESGGPRIGLVAFAGTAVVLVPPTTNIGQLLSALQGLTTSFGTAIGEGILTSLDAIAQVDHSVAPTGANIKASRGAGYSPDAIVVLTDGSNNAGVDPKTAAAAAAARKVRVFTIGFGTTTPAPMSCGPSQFGGGGFGGGGGGFGGGGFGGGGGGFGGGGFGEGRNPLVADYAALTQISHTTGGTFYRAQNASQLQTAFRHLPGTVTFTRESRDIASWFARAGGLLVATAIALPLWWNRLRRTPRPRSTPLDSRSEEATG
jgi:Ca-activated chloride channel homolog